MIAVKSCLEHINHLPFVVWRATQQWNCKARISGNNERQMMSQCFKTVIGFLVKTNWYLCNAFSMLFCKGNKYRSLMLRVATSLYVFALAHCHHRFPLFVFILVLLTLQVLHFTRYTGHLAPEFSFNTVHYSANLISLRYHSLRCYDFSLMITNVFHVLNVK